jgi:hypothetical protein
MESWPLAGTAFLNDTPAIVGLTVLMSVLGGTM